MALFVKTMACAICGDVHLVDELTPHPWGSGPGQARRHLCKPCELRLRRAETRVGAASDDTENGDGEG